jgi:hypothetical protein
VEYICTPHEAVFSNTVTPPAPHAQGKEGGGGGEREREREKDSCEDVVSDDNKTEDSILTPWGVRLRRSLVFIFICFIYFVSQV